MGPQRFTVMSLSAPTSSPIPRTNWTCYESPLGRLTLIAGERGLREVHFPGRASPLDQADRHPDALHDIVDQLQEYFAGERETFEIALDLAGTPFQRRVWRALQGLPFGRVTTYGQLARELGIQDSRRPVTDRRPVSAAQKVAWAIAATPTPIVIPCHRVVGADGSLTGYRGGLQRKRALLDLESGGSRPGVWAHQDQLKLL
jgi:methylated-DNA-[protein]-cysteine S-methyltransferase